MPIQSINPANEETLKTYDAYGDEKIEQALSQSMKAYKELNDLPISERAVRLETAADILEENKDIFAKIMTSEMGKTFKSAKSEVEKCAWVCRYYAENGEEMIADKEMETDDRRARIKYKPIGPVLAVMPWNFPFWQVFRFAAPAMIAGNTGLLKHASNVPQSALKIEEIFKQAGFPEGAFQTLLIGSDKVEKVLKDDRVKAATLTGSEKAGASVASIAGSKIKKTVLELGGSDPFIIMPSADIDAAVNAAVTGRTMNNGQSCIAAKRFIIHADIYDDVKERLVARFEELKMGDPMDEETDIGPLAMAQIRDDLDDQVQETIKKGGKLLTGAKVIDGKGYFYQPGILEDIPDDSPAASDELFGPVASLFKVADFDAAIERANNTKFGLGSAIFTNDDTEMERAAEEIEAGGTSINKIYGSDPRVPFGGIGISGYGRELSENGIHEFMNIKTIMIA